MTGREPSPTVVRRQEQHRDRWTSIGGRTGVREVSERLSPAELRRHDVFASPDYDDAFLETISPDVSIARWEAGSTLFEEGTYIDLAFHVLEGEVAVHVAGGLGRAASRPAFEDGRTGQWAIDEPAPGPSETVRLGPAPADRIGRQITFLASMDFDLGVGEVRSLGPGSFLGEIGAQSGWPQSVTARTASETTLIQIRLPALRAMRRRSGDLKDRLDRIYRETSMSAQLANTPVFRGLPRLFVDAMREIVELVAFEADERVVREGEDADALWIVRSGFVKLSQKLDEGEIVVNYLSKGMCLGDVEILGSEGRWTTSARSVEHSELLRIGAEELRAIVRHYPEVEKRLWDSAVERARETSRSRRELGRSEFLETAVDTGLVQGTALFLIDLEQCTRCDDCVRACAATHGGRPRFLREGHRLGHLQVVQACYHCRDPVCLVGCPTGAIHRAGVGEIVAVDEEICIGCRTCARSCPYDAIVMHETGETWPDDMVPESLRGRDRLVASKCDLCVGQENGPACVRNCPNGCAFRVGSLEEIDDLLGLDEERPPEP